MILTETRNRSFVEAACVMVLSIVVFAGCAHTNNPWVDSGAMIESELTTASTEGYHVQSQVTPALQSRRDWPASDVRYENGAVSHWPLWFEDPFEDKGNAFKDVEDPGAPDTEFAVNWVDYFHIPYGPGRMIFVNAAFWPVSAVVTPPGTLMESDGRISKGLVWHDHDAKRCDPALRAPPDASMAGASIERTDEPELDDADKQDAD
ncbi:MAG: hypothetical protein ABII12_11085 [Planctomycetota bacterium]